jgi:hypothetical protein
VIVDAATTFRVKVATLRFQLAAVRLENAFKANFDLEQPRVPAGSEDSGQWTRLAGDIGRLVSEFPFWNGRACVYDFGTHSVIVSGPTHSHCGSWVHWSAVTHGSILNDN